MENNFTNTDSPREKHPTGKSSTRGEPGEAAKSTEHGKPQIRKGGKARDGREGEIQKNKISTSSREDGMSLNPQSLGNGQEQHETYRLGSHMSRRLAGQTRVQYDYRHTDGELFSCVAPDLDAARKRRDAWLKNKS